MAELQVVEAPATGARLVSIEQIKMHCRIDNDLEDAHLEVLLAAATALVEERTGRRLLSQTVRVRLDAFPSSDVIEIPVAPVLSLVAVAYTDTDGVAQSLDVETLTLSAYSVPPRLQASEDGWPLTDDVLDAVRIDVSVGYLGGQYPAALQLAVLMLVGHWYANREAVGTVGPEIELAFGALIQPYRIEFCA